MRESWNNDEVRLIVADYLDMLEKELRSVDYNKTEHRRRLSNSLNGRSASAIERKHQNISAALIELGFPFIGGYKPLGNFQRLVRDEVLAQLNGNQRLTDLIREQVNEPATVPVVPDILGVLVEPPNIPGSGRHIPTAESAYPAEWQRVDYLEQEARNQSLGAAGELFVIEFEKARLMSGGREDLVSKIEHVSVTCGDRVGFDVLSFDTNRRERRIEVKTTSYGVFTPFFVTQNELMTSKRMPDSYHLYRAFEFRRGPRLFMKQGPLDRAFGLSATQYVARVI